MELVAPYSFRQHAFVSEATVELKSDGVHVARAGQRTTFLPWADVGRVRLSYEPSRVQSELYLCRIYAKGRIKPYVAISSTSFRGILNFETHLPAYRATVIALHERLRGQAGVTYHAGVSAFSYWANAIFVTGAFALLVLVLATIGQDIAWGWLIWAKFAVIAWLIPLAWGWFWANRPRAYDPNAIPPELLPSLTEA